VYPPFIKTYNFCDYFFNILFKTTEKGEPHPSTLGSPQLFKCIINL
jgi:hypothetical protein